MRTLVLTYTLTIFLSAALLFSVQPMVAKMLLPLMGGSSSVWTTSVLFFQVVLLLGYAYAHLGSKWFSIKRQASVHLGLMLLAALTLPIGVSLTPDNPSWPALWVLAALVLTVGLPFFVLSANSPMLQYWFAHSKHKTAKDPYWLYGASNIGSLLALLSYPFLIEPSITLTQQSGLWALGYGALVVGVIISAALVYKSHKLVHKDEPGRIKGRPIDWARRMKWVALAAIPSSLMLGLTEYITTDISSVPLFWVIPLSLYLLTFIIVFSRRIPHLPGMFLSGTILATVLIILIENFNFVFGWLDTPNPFASIFVAIIIHVLLFFALALLFHDLLARDRPPVSHLTEFYLWIGIGGAIGGLFNSLVAPVIFSQAIEYLVVMVVAVCAVAIYGMSKTVLAGKPWFVPSSVSFSLLLIIGVITSSYDDSHQYVRSYYGSYYVQDVPLEKGRGRVLSHGTTVHGAQLLNHNQRHIPVSYSYYTGGVGEVMSNVPHKRIGVLGLGAGAMAAYAGDGVEMDFFEIDPEMEKTAREQFSYLSGCGQSCQVHIGDGRSLLSQWEGEPFDVLFLDAYNSDSIPTHLLTKESLKLYLSRVTDNGILVFNVSNRYLDVQGLVGRLAQDAGLEAKTKDHIPSEEEVELLVDASQYVAVGRGDGYIDRLSKDDGWITTKSSDILWTDDFSNIFRSVNW